AEAAEKLIAMHARLPVPEGARLVCYEQILVRARGNVDDRLASALIPLLVPDLPVFLWWTGTPPLGSRSFTDLLRLTDRLVVDSADFARPEATLPVIARISDEA